MPESQCPADSSVTPPRQYSAKGKSSAFSPAANLDEDWTKVSDLAERRRIQNRIAQRDYREKLERRLKDLERRSQASESEGNSLETKQQKAPAHTPSKTIKKSSKNSSTSISRPFYLTTPGPLLQEDDDLMFGGRSILDNPWVLPLLAQDSLDSPFEGHSPPEDAELHQSELATIPETPSYAVPQNGKDFVAPGMEGLPSPWIPGRSQIIARGNQMHTDDLRNHAAHYRDSPHESDSLDNHECPREMEDIQERRTPSSQLLAIRRNSFDSPILSKPFTKVEWAQYFRLLRSYDEATEKDTVRNSRSPSGDSSKSEQTTDESDFEGLPESHSLMLSLPAILRSSLPRFISWANQYIGAQKIGGDGTKIQGSTDKGKTAAGSSKRKCNPHSSGSGDQDAIDDDELGSDKRRKATGPNDDDEEGLTLACPFYKKDKIAHSKCLLFRLRRIKDVKQHLARKHIQPQFCARCGHHFDTQESLRAHTRSASCALADFMEPEGITEDQKKELGARVGRKFGLAEQWYQVWDILFPRLDRPMSPFVESPIQEVLAGFRDFWTENGQSIITEHIQGTEALPYSVPHEERDLDSLYSTSLQQSIALLVDRYIDSYIARATSQTDVDVSSTQNETRTLPIETTRGLDESASTRDPGPLAFSTDRVEKDWWAGSDIGPYDQIDLATSLDILGTTAEPYQELGRPSALDDAAVTSLGSCVAPADLERLDNWMERLIEGSHGDWHAV